MDWIITELFSLFSLWHKAFSMIRYLFLIKITIYHIHINNTITNKYVIKSWLPNRKWMKFYFLCTFLFSKLETQFMFYYKYFVMLTPLQISYTLQKNQQNNRIKHINVTGKCKYITNYTLIIYLLSNYDV